MKLNLGCGLDVREGWVNIDHQPGPGVDLVVDLDRPTPNMLMPQYPIPVKLPFDDHAVTEIHASHLIEHITNVLPLLAELWRVAAPGATAVFRCPYGSSDTADEDPTHVRRMFLGSWEFFGQPAYWRASYGYGADWRTERVELHLYPLTAELPDDEIPVAVRFQRNTVQEMVATLTAVKPGRPRDRGLLQDPPVVYLRPKR